MKAVFLDRDGVINEYPGHYEYVKSWKEFHFLPNIKEALKKLNEQGFELFVVSNQAGVSKGLYTQADLDLLTKNMLAELAQSSVKISGVYYCIHRSEDNCFCRKPKTGLLDKAVASVKNTGEILDISRSYFIGDSLIDIETARAFGLKNILVLSGKETLQNQSAWLHPPDFTAKNLSVAVNLIIKGQCR
jgi:histidinol-phosphate phosphatase family protein